MTRPCPDLDLDLDLDLEWDLEWDLELDNRKFQFFVFLFFISDTIAFSDLRPLILDIDQTCDM